MEIDIILADIIATELDIDVDRVVVYNQEFDAPLDKNIYVLIMTGRTKIISCNVEFDTDSNEQIKTVLSFTELNIEIISKDRTAYERKEEIAMAIYSYFSQESQNDNQIKIFRNGEILDLSAVEGAGSLNRFRIPVKISHLKKKRTSIDYYNRFRNPTLEVDQA